MRRLTALMLLLCCAPFTPRAHAEATPEAERVLQRYLERTGGPAVFAAESTTYVHAKVYAFGFEGTFASWTARPARRFTRTELGPFKLSEGIDGTTGWRTDPTTGVVRELADHDLDDALASAWFDLERWAEPGQGGGRVRVARTDKDSTGTVTVLEVTPPDLAGGGRPVRSRFLWFSDVSGYLVRVDARSDQRETVTLYQDHRSHLGRVRSFVNEAGIASMPANRVRSVADTQLVNISVAGQPFRAPHEQATALRWLQRGGEARLPFEYRARHVWLQASVNGGPPDHFLFDTGATVTVLDSAWAAEHGLRTQGHMQAAGAGAAGGASFTTLDSLRVASRSGDGFVLADVQAAVLDVNSSFEPLFWRRMAGVIGYDIISRFVVTIDYDDSVLVLHDPATYVYRGREQPLPMVMNGTVPALKGTFEGTDEGLFRLDVGSSSTVDVHAPFARAKALRGRMGRTLRVDGMGFGGTFTSEIGRLRSMSLGPYEWDDPIVVVSNATDGAFASEDFAGNIGNRILERFRVTLDFERRHVILEPGKRYADRDRLTRAGVLLTRMHGIVTVGSVLPNSPGDHAGLMAGDEVLAIFGRPIAQWDLPQASALLDDGEIGAKIKIRIRRNETERTLKIKLAEVVR